MTQHMPRLQSTRDCQNLVSSFEEDEVFLRLDPETRFHLVMVNIHIAFGQFEVPGYQRQP